MMTPMGHKRCPHCNINLPSWLSDTTCDAHPGTPLVAYSWGHHDPHWEQKLEAAVTKVQVDARAERLADLGEYTQVKGEVFWDGGLLWVSSWDVSKAGLWNPPTFLIFQMGEKLYEIQGIDQPRRRYWIEEVVFEMEDIPTTEGETE